MDVTEAQISRIEELLAQLEKLDPAEIPEPAAELALLLNSLLGETDSP
jgi:hypothetical protein